MEKAKGSMQSFDQHLTQLYKADKITYEIALDAASSPSNFERNLEFGGNDDEDGESSNKNGPPKKEENDLELDR